MMDLRAQQYFKDEETFHRAMKLFQKYLSAASRCHTFEAMQNEFFDRLDDVTDNESALLENAADYFKSKQIDNGKNPYTSQNISETQLEKFLQLIATRTNSTNQAPLTSSRIQSISLEQSFSDFIMNKRTGWKKVSGMENGYQIYFSIFKELVGEIRTDQLTKAHVNDYIKAVQTLPSNRKKLPQYQHLAIRDFFDLDIPENDRLSAITRKRYLGQMGTYFRWLKSNDYSEIELHLPLENVKIQRARSVDQKSAYSETDLKKLFTSNEYTNGLHDEASHFWVPLIALYTGARLNEICQMSLRDVRKDKPTGLWVFDINEDLNDDALKSLKRPHHARLIPIHKKLIELGFLDFVKNQSSKNEKKLFPDLPYVSAVNKYGDKLQRWFNRTYSKTHCKVTTANTSFHSIRHTVITHLVNKKNVDPNKIAFALGQSPSGGVTQTTYTKRIGLSDYSEYFERIDFDDCFDSAQIKKWDQQLFSKSSRSRRRTR